MDESGRLIIDAPDATNMIVRTVAAQRLDQPKSTYSSVSVEESGLVDRMSRFCVTTDHESRPAVLQAHSDHDGTPQDQRCPHHRQIPQQQQSSERRSITKDLTSSTRGSRLGSVVVQCDLHPVGLLLGGDGGAGGRRRPRPLNPPLEGTDPQQPDHTETTQDETLDTACDEGSDNDGEVPRQQGEEDHRAEEDHDDEDGFFDDDGSAVSGYCNGVRVDLDRCYDDDRHHGAAEASSGFSLDAMEGRSSCGSSVTWFEGSRIEEITVEEENVLSADLEDNYSSDDDEYASEVTWYDEGSYKIEEITVADDPPLGKRDTTTKDVDHVVVIEQHAYETIQSLEASALLGSSSTAVIAGGVRSGQDTPSKA